MNNYLMERLPSLEETRSLMHEIIKLVYDHMDEIQANRYDIKIKPDGSPVTTADIFVENLISSFLKQKIPNLTFVGEESYSTVGDSEEYGYLALLDPIDGTENFCSGLKEWGVSFTLWYKSTHLGSMLFMPELNEYLMTGDQLTPLRSRIYGYSSSMCDEILTSMAEVQESRLMGCAVYNLYNVIRGSYASFKNPKGAYAWDLLPGLMLALEHNCDIKVEGKDYNGEFLSADRKYRIDIHHRYDSHPG